jgi:hypothetical protein
MVAGAMNFPSETWAAVAARLPVEVEKLSCHLMTWQLAAISRCGRDRQRGFVDFR